MRTLLIIFVLALTGGGAGAYWYTRPHPPQAATATDNTCRHTLPEGRCPFCLPALIEDMGECKEHGVPEALCWKCKPKLIEAFKIENDWCKAHDRPDSLCPICQGSAGKAAASGVQEIHHIDVQESIEKPVAADEPADKGAEQTPRSLRVPNAACKNTDTVVRFQKPETPRQADFAYAPVTEEPLARTITRNAEIAYDANHYARLSSRAAGVVAEVRRDVGASVQQGEVLAVVDSTEMGAAKADVLQSAETVKLAERNFGREKELLEKEVGVQKELNEAEKNLAESRIALARSRQRLRSLGVGPEQIDRVENTSDTSSLLELIAPFDGLIVDRKSTAVVGELAESNQPLFAIADTDSMWAMIDLRPSDLVAVKVGQDVSVTVDGLAGETFGGRLTWISTHLDEKTRTLKARAELKNRDGLLRAAMFGEAKIITRAGKSASMVPKTAVQWDGCCNIVFVRVDGDSAAFQPRKVRIGYAADERYEILAGVRPGEMVVTQGSFLLKTQIMKGSIGAGCCDAAVEELAK